MVTPVLFDNAQRADARKPSGFVVSDLMVLLLCVLAAVGIYQDRLLLAALGVLVLVLAVLSRLWARVVLSRLHYRCETSSDRAIEGDELQLTLTLENRKAIPVPWVLVREQIPAGLQLLDGQVSAAGLSRSTLLTTSTSIGAHQRVRLRFRLKAVTRGHYVLGPGRLTSGDPFGFYESERVVARAMHSLIVYPSMSTLPAGAIALARPLGDASVRTHSIDDPTLPVAVREYAPGDSMRAIDWKVTARRGAPWVRVNASSVAGAVVLVLQCDTRRRDMWDDSPDLLERIVRTAASLARDLLQQGHSVGLIANGVPPGDHARVALAPAAGNAQLGVLLDALARVQPIIVKPLDALVREHAAHVVPFGATVVGIGALADDGLRELLAERCLHGARAVHLHLGDEPLELHRYGNGVRDVVALHWPRAYGADAAADDHSGCGR